MLKTAGSLVLLVALVFGALASWDPGSAPDWPLARRMARAFAGDLGRQATSYANSGPATAPSVELLPQSASMAVDAHAAEAGVSPPAD